jgi:hypothetical protein
MSQTILAVDPGTKISGVVLWDGSVVLEAAEVSNNVLRAMIARKASEPGCDYLAIEAMSSTHGSGVGLEVLETVFWSGRIYEDWMVMRSKGKPDPIRISRQKAASYVCGTNGVGDKEVGKALKARFPGLAVTGHCLAALAVAVCAYDQLCADGKAQGAAFALTPKPEKRKSKPKPAVKKAVAAKKPAERKKKQ